MDRGQYIMNKKICFKNNNNNNIFKKMYNVYWTFNNG